MSSLPSTSKKLTYSENLQFTSDLYAAGVIGITLEEFRNLAKRGGDKDFGTLTKRGGEDLSLDPLYYKYEDLDGSEGFGGSGTYVTGKGFLVGKQKQVNGEYFPVYIPIHDAESVSGMIVIREIPKYELTKNKKTDELGTDYLSIDLITLDTEITVPNDIFQEMIKQRPEKCRKCKCIKHFSNELRRTSTEEEIIQKITSLIRTCDCTYDCTYEDF